MSDRRTAEPGPALPQVEMHLHPPDRPARGVVVETYSCTASPKSAAFVRHIVLDVSGSDLPGRIRAGQSFGVLPPGTTEQGRPHKVRLYSIANATGGEGGDENLIATTVKRTIDEHWETHRLFLGVASNWLCDLQVGDEIRVTGPNGKRFLLPARPDDHDYVFFATGTGIAPFRGMVRELLSRPDHRSKIVLVMGSPFGTDLLYHKEFRALQDTHPNFTYLSALSRESQPDGSPPMYVQSRLGSHAELFRGILSTERGLVYACGLAGMELGIVQGLYRLLPAEEFARYVTLAPGLESDPTGWTRRMIPREIAPTRRMFLEVY
ncbi:MAG: hypothetical protein IPJ41_12655 [Phycisphaerales bacterium]|nr:hypothetical protein [Phycisphaerales bacterium]